MIQGWFQGLADVTRAIRRHNALSDQATSTYSAVGCFYAPAFTKTFRKLWANCYWIGGFRFTWRSALPPNASSAQCWHSSPSNPLIRFQLCGRVTTHPQRVVDSPGA
jgi:hypothetical protein